MTPVPPVTIGFVGFGEVAVAFAGPLIEHGAQVLAYDILLKQPGGRETLEKRFPPGLAAQAIQLESLLETVQSSDYVLSAVTTSVAQQVAHECLPHLKPGKVYVDLNSTAPSIKIELAKIISPSGADFVEGAILGAVGVTGAKTHILLGGEKALTAVGQLRELGLNVTHYSREIGQASMFKMLRSVFSKGLEALVLEFLIAGKRAGLEQELWDEVVQLMSRHPFDETCANWIATHTVAFQRRYAEVIQVAETMREIGIEPLMTAGTRAFFRRSCELGLNEGFSEKPNSMGAVIDFMEQRLRESTG